MEINLNCVLFEELTEKADGSGAMARIVIARQSTDSNLALEDGAVSFYPLE
jgi:hypothetical protein